MTKQQKLELTWVGKGERPRLEPRILIEDPELSYVAPRRVGDTDQFDNKLIFGDNLLALRALEQEYAGRVQCVYIDPPYNTGSAFTHYDDGLAHSVWLTLMRDRLEVLRRLLRPEGVVFVHIDDTEHAYLKVLMDEVFGRRNFCGQLVWEKKKKPSFLNANMGVVTEYVLSYALDRTLAPAFVGGLTTVGKKYPLNNAGNGVQVLHFPAGSVRFGCRDQVFHPQDMSEGNIITRLLDDCVVVDGRNVAPFHLEGEWRYSQSTVNDIIASGEELYISKAPFRPNHVKAGGEEKKMKNLLTVAGSKMATYEDATKESEALFGSDSFDYPKPEQLLATIISAVTDPGDLVLDSFAGSGTTGAVAHKLGRRWLMVELGEHCHTHILPRLQKVINGGDPGGITEQVGWNGGGGFRYFRLAPSLMTKDSHGQWVIAPAYNAARLAEAVCKLEGFRYDPSPSDYWQQGRSTGRDFIFVTTQSLTKAQLTALSHLVGPDRTLLVCCSAFKGSPEAWPNLTVKKIPNAVLGRCEFGRDDYSLKVAALPQALATEPPEAHSTLAPASKAKRATAPKDLFSGEGEP